MTPIEQAVKAAGGPTALAKAIEVTPSFVSQLLSGKRPIPATLCGPIESATGGAVTRNQLRPDVFDEVAA